MKNISGCIADHLFMNPKKQIIQLPEFLFTKCWSFIGSFWNLKFESAKVFKSFREKIYFPYLAETELDKHICDFQKGLAL